MSFPHSTFSFLCLLFFSFFLFFLFSSQLFLQFPFSFLFMGEFTTIFAIIFLSIFCPFLFFFCYFLFLPYFFNYSFFTIQKCKYNRFYLEYAYSNHKHFLFIIKTQVNNSSAISESDRPCDNSQKSKHNSQEYLNPKPRLAFKRRNRLSNWNEIWMVNIWYR